tara:strand:- start:14 stop:145 length:132 start_codon:yes stop_codon:yes gene_type:complete
MNLISCCGGKLTIFEITKKMNKNLEKIKDELIILSEEKLISFI